jgi:hypothetical protein
LHASRHAFDATQSCATPTNTATLHSTSSNQLGLVCSHTKMLKATSHIKHHKRGWLTAQHEQSQAKLKALQFSELPSL